MMIHKQVKNSNRTWPKPVSENEPIEHVREETRLCSDCRVPLESFTAADVEWCPKCRKTFYERETKPKPVSFTELHFESVRDSIEAALNAMGYASMERKDIQARIMDHLKASIMLCNR